MPPWFPGDPGSPGGPGVGGLSTVTRVQTPPAGVVAEPQSADPEWEPNRYRSIRGYVFPPAGQALTAGQGTLYGDAGDGEHEFTVPGAARASKDAGRDTMSDGGWRGQFAAPFWGMLGAIFDFRSRYLVALDQPSIARPQFAPRSMAMRPSAMAVSVREFGEPPGVQTRRTVAPGRVTQWGQATLMWPQFGRGQQGPGAGSG